MAQFNLLELKTKAATLAEQENRNYIIILKSGAIRPERNNDDRDVLMMVVNHY